MNIEMHELFGLAGTLMILAAYLLLQLDRIENDDLSYSVLNLIGAALIVYSLIFDFNLAAIIMEGTWILISLFGVWKFLRAQRAVRMIDPNG